MASGSSSEPRRIVVVGTGTEVGKTFVACALVRALREAGEEVVGLKPVESGVGADGVWRDASALTEAGGRGPGAPLLGFERPVSPHLEARRTGRTVRLEEVVAWVEREGEGSAWVVIETAGGLLSPLNDEGATNATMTEALEPDLVVLVGRDGLGVLHDMAAARWVLRDLGLWPRVRVALSQAPPADASTGSNATELMRLATTDTVAVVDADGGSSVPWRSWLGLP